MKFKLALLSVLFTIGVSSVQAADNTPEILASVSAKSVHAMNISDSKTIRGTALAHISGYGSFWTYTFGYPVNRYGVRFTNIYHIPGTNYYVSR